MNSSYVVLSLAVIAVAVIAGCAGDNGGDGKLPDCPPGTSATTAMTTATTTGGNTREITRTVPGGPTITVTPPAADNDGFSQNQTSPTSPAGTTTGKTCEPVTATATATTTSAAATPTTSMAGDGGTKSTTPSRQT